MIVNVHDVTAKCEGCGAKEFDPVLGGELELESVLVCRSCGARTSYRNLLDQIGEEAMSQANKALADLKRKAPRRRKPKK